MRKLVLVAACDDLALAARQASMLGAGAVEQADFSDTFFNVAEGALWLREFRGSPLKIAGTEESFGGAPAARARLFAEIDDEGALRQTEMPASDPAAAKAFFARALGIRATLRLARLTHGFHDMLVHFDETDGLGGFLAFELPLAEGDKLDFAIGKLDDVAIAFGATGPRARSYAELVAKGK